MDPDPVLWIRIQWIRTVINWPPGSGSVTSDLPYGSGSTISEQLDTCATGTQFWLLVVGTKKLQI